jgi:hypothetical protein
VGIALAIRSAVEAIDASTDSLQEEVIHQTVTRDALGSETPGAPVPRMARVSRKQGSVPTPGGQEIKILAIVSFLAPVAIGAGDKVTLADGTTGPLYIPQGGTLDPATGTPFTTTVYLRR